MYEESTASVRPMIPRWLTRSRGRRYEAKEYKSPGPGAASLKDIAIRSAVLHVDNIPPEVLECVPWVVGKRIADYLTRTEAWSLKTWGVFATAYSEEEDPILKQYRISLRAKAGEHVHELDPILKQISVLSFDHITNLSIQRLKFTQSVFIIILKIPNLGVLALTHNQIGADVGDSEDINDNFVKKWSRLVVEECRLLKLKVFILRHFALTSCILDYFSALPALLLCNIESWILDPDPIGGINPRWGWDLLDGAERNWDPEKMWHLQTISTHTLLSKCYKYAITHIPCTPDNTKPAMPKSPVLSIDYGALRYQTMARKSRSIWYNRVPLTQSVVAAQQAKSASVAPQNRTERTRSIRSEKQIDLGEFLGSF